MKLALVSLTLFVILEAYNARHLHDVSMKESFDERSIFHGAVIQMVTREHELRLPQSPQLSLSYDHTTYGRVISSPPPTPKPAPSKGQETYGRVNTSPPPPKVAPSKGQETNVQVKASPPPPPKVAPSKGQETLGRDDPKSPPGPDPNDSQRQSTDNRVNPSPPADPLLSDGGSACIGLSTSQMKMVATGWYLTSLEYS